MTIESSIQSIIDKRKGLGVYQGHGRVDSVAERKTFFESLKKTVLSFKDYRSLILQQISDKEGAYYEMSVNDPTFESRLVNCSPDSVIQAINDSLHECDNLMKRFSRDSINISVVGRAGQGKSTLLQSISGLSNEIIPASDGADCTGAKSVILNRPGKTSARIVYYSEDELVACIRKYLIELKSSSITINSAASIPMINLTEVQNNMEPNQKSRSRFEHLRKYISHYSDYSCYIGTVKDNITDESEIRRYVAQYDIEDNPTFIYLAVKEAQIFTEFPIKDAGRIMLVDTIGLGDTSLGIRDHMLDTLFKDSDAALGLRRPDAKRDALIEEDDDLLDLLADKLTGRAANKWLFYVLNVSEGLNNKKTGKTIFDQLKDRVSKGNGELEFIWMIDCHDKNAVKNELCAPLLESLVKNLDAIDNDIIKLSNQVLHRCFLSYLDLLGKIQKVTYGGISKVISIGSEFDDLFDKKLQLSPALKILNEKYKELRGTSNSAIQTEISKVLKTIPRHCPSVEEIQERMRFGGSNSYYPNVYSFFADNVRSHISDDFEAINESTIVALQEMIKEEIVNILQSIDYGRLILIPLIHYQSDLGPVSWLKIFTEEKLENYPLVADAFSFILNYRLNIEGLLDYQVNQSLECLDPLSTSFNHIDFTGMSEDVAAEAIEQNLLSCMTKIASHLRSNISVLEMIPNNSFYARIRKFREKIIFSEDGYKELKNFYRDNCMVIWKKEMTSIVNNQTALGDWNDYSSSLSQSNNSSNFEIKL